ncbi:hypothetical protein JTB14_036266 [Gonioctena quinquepunctata]|nr:hypothetical protein JTB14_036266 [Gonioctena quinquepunctata]
MYPRVEYSISRKTFWGARSVKGLQTLRLFFYSSVRNSCQAQFHIMNDTNGTATFEQVLNNSLIFRECGRYQNTTPGYCPEVFDNLLYVLLSFEICWPETPPGTKANRSCPKVAHLGWDQNRFAYKECLENGSWFRRGDGVWTNYTDCVNHEEYEVRKN